MDIYEITNEVFNSVGEIVQKSDLISAGLKDNDIYKLFKIGHITRIKKGFYKLTKSNNLKEEKLLSLFMGKGVVCVESALFYYGYSDFTPRKWTIAVPRTYYRNIEKIQERIPIKPYYVQNKTYQIGKTINVFNDVELPVYDRERTICDCFKYRTKLDNEIFNKAINAYVKDENKNLCNLSKYAKQMGIYKKLMNVMEVMLND